MTPTLTEEEIISSITVIMPPFEDYLWFTIKEVRTAIDLARKGYITEDNSKEWGDFKNA